MKPSRPGRVNHDHYVAHTSCPCGKRAFWRRRDAKVAIKNLRRRGDDPDAQLLKAYQCELSGNLWHVGHNRKQRPNHNDPRLRFVFEF